MSTSEFKPTRAWREIAQAVLQEEDHEKALELAQELIRALDAESMQGMERTNAEEKAPETGDETN